MQLFQDVLLHNCISTLPQSNAEVRTEKVAELYSKEKLVTQKSKPVIHVMSGDPDS